MAHLPAGFAAQQQDGFPLNLKARVPAAVGGEAVCSLGTTFTPVMRKRLTAMDLDRHEGPLSIPGKQNVRELLELLTNQEGSELRMGETIKLGFFLDPDLEVAAPNERTRLAAWKTWKNTVFAVTGGGWRWVLEKKGLDIKVGDVIQLWSFRTASTGELCFVLVTADTRRRVAEQEAAVAAAAMRSTREEEEEKHPALDLKRRLKLSD